MKIMSIFKQTMDGFFPRVRTIYLHQQNFKTKSCFFIEIIDIFLGEKKTTTNNAVLIHYLNIGLCN